MYLKSPLQGVLINGPTGAGKGFMANYLATNYPGTQEHNIYRIEPLEDKKHIGIDQIKLIISILRTKQPRRLFIIIENCDKITPEAQNALLKILEEPPNNVSFILTTARLNGVLTTIRSRLTIIDWVAPDASVVKQYGQSFNSDKLETFLNISSGRIGLLNALLTNQETHPLLGALEKAKLVLANPISDRMSIMDELIKDTDSRSLFMEALFLVTRTGIQNSANKGHANQWLTRAKSITRASEQLDKNVQPKLVLGRLFLVI
jgi:replication-associated recombination protein RarA